MPAERARFGRVTPRRSAALVAFIWLSPDFETRLVIGGILFVIMALNLIVMRVSRHMLPVLGVRLPMRIGVDPLALLLGTIEPRRDLKAMHQHDPGMPASMSAVVAVLVGSLGYLALLAVIFRA